ncbi:MAG: hypothetical protein ACJA2Q_000962 [Pseudohongiellaceae bacterium]|jgi:hypothetical protein
MFLILTNLGYFAWLKFGAIPIAPVGLSESGPLLSDGMILLSEYNARVAEEDLIRSAQSRMCLTVTGFSNFDDAVSFENAAFNSGLSTSQQLIGSLLASQFRVFLPPASSQAVAAITLDALNEKVAQAELAIETYLITRGLLENAIALGVVSSLAEAEEIQSALVNLGYIPEIQELLQSDGGIAVHLSAASSLSLESSQWLGLILQRSYLVAVENVCETIAQGAQFP